LDDARSRRAVTTARGPRVFSSEQLRKSGSTMLTAGSVPALQSSKKRSMCLKWRQQRQAPRGQLMPSRSSSSKVVPVRG